MSNEHSASLWQRGLLALCALATAAILFSIHSGAIMSDSSRGFQLDTVAGKPFSARVSYVAPAGAAAQADLRVGDVIDLLQLSPGQRYHVVNGVAPGERIAMPVTRAGKQLTIHYIGGSLPIRWDVWLYYAGALWSVFVGALLVWRRPEQVEARVLCVLLLGVYVSSLYGPGNWASGSAGFDAVLAQIVNAALTLSLPLLGVYGLQFARPPSTMRRNLVLSSYAFALLAIVLSVRSAIYFWMGLPVDNAILDSPILAGVASAGVWLLPLVCLIATIRAAKNPERDRILWTSATLGVYYVTFLLNAIFLLLPELASSPLLRNEEMVTDIFALLAPLGMAYAVLNRRVLDIGFALNRAVVFSAVSLVLVGAFVLAEWALSEWMRSANHQTNIAVSAGLALALGLSIRVVHGKVEHVVDHVIFRKRRVDEEAIRDMARQAPYITDSSILLQRVAQTLSTNADASFATILLRDDSGNYGAIEENDPAIVALRTYHKVLDLHTVATAVGGEWAYPMVARGQLVAALALGPKRSGESYAPDESAAIAYLSSSAAGALDALLLKQSSHPEAALERIESLLLNVLRRLAQMPAEAETPN